jgi:hypothetical protein
LGVSGAPDDTIAPTSAPQRRKAPPEAPLARPAIFKARSLPRRPQTDDSPSGFRGAAAEQEANNEANRTARAETTEPQDASKPTTPQRLALSRLKHQKQPSKPAGIGLM